MEKSWSLERKDTDGSSSVVTGEPERRKLRLGSTVWKLKGSCRRVSQLLHPTMSNTLRLSLLFIYLQVDTGSLDLGSFIREATERDSWIANKVNDCMHSIKKPAGAARAYPFYSVQQEWQYLQRSIPSIESCFHLLQKAMQDES